MKSLMAISRFLRQNLAGLEKISQINSLFLHLTKLEREEQTKLKFSRRKEITKIKAEVNEIKIWKKIEKSNETKRWFEKINLTNHK